MKSSFTDTVAAAGAQTAGACSPTELVDEGRASSLGMRLLKRSSSWALPLVVLLVILIIWQTLVEVLGLKSYFIPSPIKVAVTLKENLRSITDNSVPTITQAAAGFGVGNALAVLMSIWFVHVSSAREERSIRWPSSCRASPLSPWRLS